METDEQAIKGSTMVASSSSPSTSATIMYPCAIKGNNKPSPLAGTDDLLTHFGLSGLYDDFVRPYLSPHLTTSQQQQQQQQQQQATTDRKPSSPHNELQQQQLSLTTQSKKHSGGSKLSRRYHEWIPDVGGYCPPRADKDPERQSLVALFRPDYVPPPPVDQHSIDDDQVRSVFGGFSKGDLEGFDQSVWETSDTDPHNRKRKKRKHHSSQGHIPVGDFQQPATNGTGGEESQKMSIKLSLGNGNSGSSPMSQQMMDDEHRKKKRKKEMQ